MLCSGLSHIFLCSQHRKSSCLSKLQLAYHSNADLLLCHLPPAACQVGCPMRCTFCATGKGGFARNLLPHEIMDQVCDMRRMD